MKRFGQIIGVKQEKLEEYKKYHAAVWPEVLEMIRLCNIRNYSIFYKDGMLYAYFEYVGDDFDADMAKMAADPMTQKWWDVMMPMHPGGHSRGRRVVGQPGRSLSRRLTLESNLEVGTIYG